MSSRKGREGGRESKVDQQVEHPRVCASQLHLRMCASQLHARVCASKLHPLLRSAFASTGVCASSAFASFTSFEDPDHWREKKTVGKESLE